MDQVKLHIHLSFGINYIVPVRRPGGAGKVLIPLLRYLERIFFLRIDPPDIFRAAAVAGKKDLLSIRTPPRMGIKGDPPCQRSGLPSRYRYGIQVAHHVEYDGLTVRTDIQRGPCAFG